MYVLIIVHADEPQLDQYYGPFATDAEALDYHRRLKEEGAEMLSGRFRVESIGSPSL